MSFNMRSSKLQSRGAAIKFSARKDCFVSLPRSWSSFLNGSHELMALKIENSNGASICTTWSGDFSAQKGGSMYSNSDHVIEIGGFFAAKQGFTSGEMVHVTEITNVSLCETVQVIPSSVDDWEILEMNSQYIEKDLLNQVRLISRGQCLPMWIQRQTCIFVVIESTDASCQYGLLSNNTELIVTPKLKPHMSNGCQSSTNSALPPEAQPTRLQNGNHSNTGRSHSKNGENGDSPLSNLSKMQNSGLNEIMEDERKLRNGHGFDTTNKENESFDKDVLHNRVHNNESDVNISSQNIYKSENSDDSVLNNDDDNEFNDDNEHDDELNNNYDDNYDDDNNYDDDDDDDDDDDENINNNNNESEEESSGSVFGWLKRQVTSAVSSLWQSDDQAPLRSSTGSRRGTRAPRTLYRPEILSRTPYFSTWRVLPLEEFLSPAHSGEISRNRDTNVTGFCSCGDQVENVEEGRDEELLGVVGDCENQECCEGDSANLACSSNKYSSVSHHNASKSNSRKFGVRKNSPRIRRTSSRLRKERHDNCHRDCHELCAPDSCATAPCKQPTCRHMVDNSSSMNEGNNICETKCQSSCLSKSKRRSKVQFPEGSASEAVVTLESFWEQGCIDLSQQPSTIYVSRETVPEISRQVKSFLARLTRIDSPKEKEEEEKSKAGKKMPTKSEPTSEAGKEQGTGIEKERREIFSVTVRVVVIDYDGDERAGKKEKSFKGHLSQGDERVGAKEKSFKGLLSQGDERAGKKEKSPGYLERRKFFLNMGYENLQEICRCVRCNGIRLPADMCRDHLVKLRNGVVWLDGLTMVPQGGVLVPRCLRDELMLDRSCRVSVTSLTLLEDWSLTFPRVPIEIYALAEVPEGFSGEMFEIAVRHHLLSHSSVQCPILLNPIQIIDCFLTQQNVRFPLVLHVTPPPGVASAVGGGSPYYLLNSRVVRWMGLKFRGELKERRSYNLEQIDEEVLSVFNRVHLDRSVMEPAMSHIVFILSSHSSIKHGGSDVICGNNGAILLVGPKGVGKTTVAMVMCLTIHLAPYFAYMMRVDCRDWRGKRPDSIQAKMEGILNELRHREPAVLLLDNLDEIVPPPRGPEEELSSHHTLTAIMLRDQLLAELSRSGSKVIVIATAQSRSSLSDVIVNSRGVHLFSVTIELKAPDLPAREKILEKLLSSDVTGVMSSVDVGDVARKTENFVAKDLDMVVARALLNAVCAHQGSSSTIPVIHQTDILDALNEFTPASLRDVPLVTGGTLCWGDVGGLSDVRRTLAETLEWPFLYRKLYAECPIRMNSGILLYGAPGTGKTLLAAVVAKEFNFNFVSVKGPELLNKYIGASEQAVRNIFQRAQSAKPCILFFDEFDSLAPRAFLLSISRSKESTFLSKVEMLWSLEVKQTQIFAKKQTGVYVLAATSRPDLIDPALLRPGRLDKAIFCPIPAQEGRHEILKVLGRKMTFSDDVDLCELSSERYTDQLTGADLKALLYDAQLSAIHERQGTLMGHGAIRDKGAEFGMAEKGQNQSGKRNNSEISINDDGSVRIDKHKQILKRNESIKQNGDDSEIRQNSEGDQSFENGDLHSVLAEYKEEEGKICVVQLEGHVTQGENMSSDKNITLENAEEEKYAKNKYGSEKAYLIEKQNLNDSGKETVKDKKGIANGTENLVESKGKDKGKKKSKGKEKSNSQGTELVNENDSKMVKEDIFVNVTPNIPAKCESMEISGKKDTSKSTSKRAVEEVGDKKTPGSAGVGSSKVVVTWEHLIQAAKDLRPSVSPAERKRFDTIYEQFVAFRSKMLIGKDKVGQRATLA